MAGRLGSDLGYGMDSSYTQWFSVCNGEREYILQSGSCLVSIAQTDGGESWHLFMDGMVGTGIQDLVAVNNRLYALTKGDIVQSTDGGESWSTVRVNVSKVNNPKPLKEGHSRLNFSADSRLTIAGNSLYVITPEKDDLRVFRLSADGNALIPVEGVPAFEVDVPSTNNEAAEQDGLI